MSLSNFPDVPFMPGVPAVLRNPQAALGSVVNSVQNQIVGAAQQAVSGAISNVQRAFGNLPNIPGVGNATGLINGAFGMPADILSADDPSVSSAALAPGQWGIFDQSGNLVLTPDSFKDIAYKQDFRIADYPMEAGAFESYNKVQTPFDVRLTLTKGGTDSDRIDFLNALDAAANSIDLYNVVTPERTYRNVSISHNDYKRTAVNGVGLLTVDIGLVEIRIAPAGSFSNTAMPNGADQVNSGTVQAIPVTTGPNLTDGLPTCSAAFETGAAALPALAPYASAATSLSGASVVLNASIVAAVETPIIQRTAPAFAIASAFSLNSAPLSASGLPLTSSQVAAGAQYFAVSAATGLLQTTIGAITYPVATPPKVT